MITLRPLELGDAPAICAAVDCSREALRRWMVWYRDDYDNRAAEVWLQHARAVAVANVPSRRVLEANGFRAVDSREVDERGDTPLVYELELVESRP